MIPLSSNDRAKHRCVLFLRAEVHEVTKRDECSGRPVYKVPEMVLRIDGADKHIALRKLNEAIAELKKLCS